MAELNVLTVFQVLMIVVDSCGIIGAFIVGEYYRKGWRQPQIFNIWILMKVILATFIIITVSDILVITRSSLWWATLPIVRGHFVRTPLVIALMWMAYRIYGAKRDGRTG